MKPWRWGKAGSRPFPKPRGSRGQPSIEPFTRCNGISRSSYRNLLRDGFAGQAGSCHSLASADETLVDDLRVLLDGDDGGDPMCPLLWNLARARGSWPGSCNARDIRSAT